MSILNFLGDVHLEKPARSAVPLEGDYVCNLEGPITSAGRPAWGKICLKAGGLFFAETFGANPIAVCLANNHILDYGEEGLRDTIQALEQRGIGCFGAGRLAEGCRNPLVLRRGGPPVALLGYACPSTHPVLAAGAACGAAPLDLELIARDLAAARAAGARRAVVQLHWGVEDVWLPRPADVARARRIVELGADLIIGHHAHCIQGWEVYRGRHIFYGLGNAVFPDAEPAAYSPAGARLDDRALPWRKWNRRSLAVRYDPATQAVQVRLLFFGSALKVVPGARPERRFAFRARLDRRYERQYALVRRWSALRRLAASFLQRPRLPKARNRRWLRELFRAGG